MATTAMSSNTAAPTLVFKPDNGDVFTLNPTGALVWGLYSKGLSADTVARQLEKRYRIGYEQAQRDVFTFIAQVRRHGLAILA
jgi:hypothetical protein